MSQYTATVHWQRQAHEPFSDNLYSRGHEWRFDGGVVVSASASPHVVPLPLSVEQNVDPEEAFVAALSSCHMLTFLGIVAKKRYVVEEYTDHAVGRMEENEQGRMWVSQVVLRPKIRFAGELQPTREQLEKWHHLAHQHCFIANSVKTQVSTEF
ncbi:peroxiredoxin [Vibrio navarrensis]|uniref:OsmC family protein n=1 Tax=Vibrio navarrensis TaxID=29495 RepID=UPI001869BDB7|nr:OsmC family protein [Vibrio navarrensis]MBE4592068.1 peroxiredoxin [Vibrio navarrensis]